MIMRKESYAALNYRANASLDVQNWQVLRKKFTLTCGVFVMILLFFTFLQNLQHVILPAVRFYQPSLSESDRELLYKTIEDLTDALDKKGLFHMMTFGSLLGSFRHADLIPWDDDFDVCFNISQREEVLSVLLSLEPEYVLDINDDEFYEQQKPWKFYPKLSSHYFNRFGFPFIDIFFMAENETHIWNVIPRYFSQTCVEKSQTFPLVRRHFGELMLFAPCNLEHHISLMFGNTDICRSREYSHAYGLSFFWTPVKTVPCSLLHPYFQFVMHEKDPRKNSVNETIIRNGVLLEKYTRLEMCS